jgi:hypothetical protein
VSDKLLGQFVACLEQRSGVPDGDAAPADVAPEPSTPPDEPPAPSEALAEPPAPSAEAVSRPPDHGDGPGTATRPAVDGAAARPADSPPPAGDALDLGATLLPVLARAYWKQALAGLVGLVVVVRLLRRLSR